jgi:hypothetical protein
VGIGAQPIRTNIHSDTAALAENCSQCVPSMTSSTVSTVHRTLQVTQAAVQTDSAHILADTHTSSLLLADSSPRKKAEGSPCLRATQT